MSLNVQNPLTPQAVITYNLDFTNRNEEDYIEVLKGPSTTNYFTASPTGGKDSNSEVNFDIFNTSKNRSVLNKSVLLTGTMEVTINSPTLTTAGTTVDMRKLYGTLMQGRMAMAANPIFAALNNISVSFDGQVNTENVNAYNRFIKYFNYDEDSLKYWDSYTPSYLDNSYFFMNGTKKNVLGSDKDTSLNGIKPRGAYGYYKPEGTVPAANVSNGTLKFNIDVAEVINISPFCTTMNVDANDTGFTGWGNLKLSLNFLSGEAMFNNCVSINPFTDTSNYLKMDAETNVYSAPELTKIDLPAYTVSTGASTTANKPASYFKGSCVLKDIKLLCRFDQLGYTTFSPERFNYSYNKIQYLQQTYKGIAAAKDITSVNPTPNQKQLDLNSIQLSSIPSKVIIAVLNKTITDNSAIEIPQNQRGISFLPIHNIRISMMNDTSILSNCGPELLYHKTVENGLRFIDYSNSGMGGKYISFDSGNLIIPQGAPIALKFGSDITFSDVSISAGVSINTTFQASISVYNYYTREVDADVITIFIYEGVFTIIPTAVPSYQYAILTREDVINADIENGISTQQLNKEIQFNGASLWSKLKKFGKNVKKVVKSPEFRKGLSFLGDMNLPGISQAANFTQDLLEDGKGGRLLSQQGGRLLSQNGGAMIAGAKSMNASQLRQRLIK